DQRRRTGQRLAPIPVEPDRAQQQLRLVAGRWKPGERRRGWLSGGDGDATLDLGQREVDVSVTAVTDEGTTTATRASEWPLSLAPTTVALSSRAGPPASPAARARAPATR